MTRRVWIGRVATMVAWSVVWVSTFAGCGKKEEPLGDATEHFLAAEEALAKGDKETALRELDASIAAGPETWIYFSRARLHTDMKNDAKAIADCEAGLKLDADNKKLKWLLTELKRPADQRFRGANAEPPSGK